MIKITDVTKEEEQQFKEVIKRSGGEIHEIIEGTLNDDEVYYTPGITFKGRDFEYVIFNRVAETTWTGSTQVIFTNDINVVDDFINSVSI